ncbi:unnamed protein product [Effrenium voratum]|uniref:Transmembrane protein n=1 Tax=Effrenium voratum TaxID=2562239 RepID=A0AA36JM92_9DINO|nr:unnamed protein product [Effrenium voratum]
MEPEELEIWPDSGREKVLERDWRSIFRVHLDDVEKYGLEYCLYFQSLRVLCAMLFLTCIPGTLELLYLLNGPVFSTAPVALFARLTLGNLDAFLDASLSPVGWPTDAESLRLLMTLQLLAPSLSLLGLVFAWRRLSSHPDLATEPSVADYAVEVQGLPQDLLESELLTHFEELLRKRFAGAGVCDLAVVRAGPEDATQEGERPVLTTFVVLGSEEERNWLLRGYRYAWLTYPCFQRALRFRGLALRLSPAPEPCDILWSQKSRRAFGAWWVFAAFSSLVLWALAACGAAGIWWALGEVETLQCTWQDASSCSCTCDLKSGGAVLGCVLLVELLRACRRVAHAQMRCWSSSLASSQERLKLLLSTLSQAAEPLAPLAGLYALKLLWWLQVLDGPTHFTWEVDSAAYLYAMPVIMLWCLFRWLGLICERLCFSQRFGSLREQYARLASLLAVTIMLQPVAPVLSMLGAVGLLGLYWAQKYALPGTTVRTGTPVRLALCSAHLVAWLLWSACVVGCGLVLSTAPGATASAGLSGAPGVLGLVLLLLPLAWLALRLLWLLGLLSWPPGNVHQTTRTRSRALCCSCKAPRAAPNTSPGTST